MNVPVTPVQPEGATASKDERTMAVLAHLSGLAGFLVPLGHIGGPLLVWLLKKDSMPLVDEHGKEALNFQLSVTLYAIVSIVLAFVVIGLFLLLGLLIFEIVVMIQAAIKANQGQPYRYPLTIRFIS